MIPLLPPKDETGDIIGSHSALYQHRNLLFLALLKSGVVRAWKSRLHADGTSCDPCWFVAGCTLPAGDISYALPAWMWDDTQAEALPIAPPWDGHTARDVAARLLGWVQGHTHKLVK